MRRAFALLSALSALAFVALCLASLGRGVDLRRSPISAGVGDDLILTTGSFPPKGDDLWAGFQMRDERWLGGLVRLTTWQEPGEAGRRWRLILPTLLLFAATAVMPTLWGMAWLLGFWRFLRLTTRGRCGRCGYDLRGGSERCPECGLPSLSLAAP